MSPDGRTIPRPSLWLFVSLALILLPGVVLADTTIVGESQRSTATERNNARLVAKDGAGVLHIVYYDDGIIHSFSNDNARTWSLPQRITDIGRNPAIALGGDDELHLVYKLGGITAYDIVHRSYNGTWSEETIVYNSPQVPVSRPVPAVDSTGDLHCVWQRSGYGSTPNSEVWYRKRTAGNWGAAMNVSNTYGSSEYPTLAIGADDNVHVFWKDSGENISNPKMVLYRKYTAGSGWGPGYTNVSGTTGNGSSATMDPCAVLDSQSDIHLVWKDFQPGNREIFYKKCTDGVWDETPLNLSETDEASDTPSISVDDNDNLTVAWAEKTDGIHYDVIVREYSQASTAWSTATNISNTAGSNSRYPNVPAATGSGLICIWTEGNSYPYDIICWYDGTASPVDDIAIPSPSAKARLLPNHPNPFTVSFELPEDAMVSLAIYGASGGLIRTLVAGWRGAGLNSTTWYGRDDQGMAIGSGVYFFCLNVGGVREVRKMVLLR
jgi:hypothetical protein